MRVRLKGEEKVRNEKEADSKGRESERAEIK